MQYNVPQFVDVEDKIFGPLTLKQFLILVFGGLVAFMFWGIFGPSIIFFLLVIPVGIVFAYLALGKFNGQPVLTSLPAFLQFFLRPRYRVFKRTGGKSKIIKTKEAPKEPELIKAEDMEPKGSRLKNLAYILDQRSSEEKRLLEEQSAGGQDNLY